jgi:hypothetical protein
VCDDLLQAKKALYSVSGGKAMAVENVLRHIYEAYEVSTSWHVAVCMR